MEEEDMEEEENKEDDEEEEDKEEGEGNEDLLEKILADVAAKKQEKAAMQVWM